MSYVMQDFADAAQLLHEVIRQAPNYADPYHTMGLIFEETGEPKKALQYFMISAHLNPKNVELWKQVGSMSR